METEETEEGRSSTRSSEDYHVPRVLRLISKHPAGTTDYGLCENFLRWMEVNGPFFFFSRHVRILTTYIDALFFVNLEIFVNYLYGPPSILRLSRSESVRFLRPNEERRTML